MRRVRIGQREEKRKSEGKKTDRKREWKRKERKWIEIERRRKG